MSALENVPSMLVIFRGDVNRTLEGHVMQSFLDQTPERREAGYAYHEAAGLRPEEKIYFLHETPDVIKQAQYLDDLKQYSGLTMTFSQQSLGIHVPAQGGPYMATSKLVVEAPAAP